MRAYESVLFDQEPDWKQVPVAPIDQFHWEQEPPFRPASFAQLCGLRGKGLLARLWSFEENPRRVCANRDEPVYQDSCLELFLNPLPQTSDCYVNVEMNAAGVFLSQFGAGREDRRFLRDCTALSPEVSAFTLEEDGAAAWGVTVFLSDALLSEVYQTPYATAPGALRGNFYKCGDLTQHPHFGALSPVTTAALGFHNPDCFAHILLR